MAKDNSKAPVFTKMTDLDVLLDQLRDQVSSLEKRLRYVMEDPEPADGEEDKDVVEPSEAEVDLERFCRKVEGLSETVGDISDRLRI